MASSLRIPFGQPSFGDDEIAAVTRVLRSGWIGMGPETLAFEQELAAALGAPEIVTVSSCTGALFLALRVLGIGPGDEVICPSLTWCATANAALYLGARAVFCDVDPTTFCLSAETVAARLSPRTRAVIAVHYGGQAAEIDAIRAILPSGVALVEDAAHALGARHGDGTPVGSSGRLTCFSFYANKNLSTGEGGAIALADTQTAEHLRSLRQNAMPNNAWMRFQRPTSAVAAYDIEELGYKLNYTDLQAAIGRVQLRRQTDFAGHRLAIAQLYLAELARRAPDLVAQAGLETAGHARHLFVLAIPRERLKRSRDDIVARVREAGIGLSVHYRLLHRMPLYAPQAPLPVAEDLAERIVTLPIGAAMTLDDAQASIDALLDELG